MDTRPKLPRVDELDGLRGVLASWVALSHIFCWSGMATVDWPQPFARIWTNFVFAQPAVEVFIILSGFAISFLLHARKQSYGDFMRGRFFRIYPIYLTCLALGLGTIYLTPVLLQKPLWHDTMYFQGVAAISQSERQHLLAHGLAHLTLLHGVIPGRLLAEATGTLLPPAWSISLEWQYYLVAPFIAVGVCSGIRLLILCGIAYIGIRLESHWLNPHLAFLPAQLPLFLLGIGSYHFYALITRTTRWGSARSTLPAAALLSGAILLSWHPVTLAIWAVAFGCIFVSGEGGLNQTLGWVRRGLRHRWLQYLGSISYPLYLVHWPVIIVSMALLLHWRPMIRSGEAAISMLFLATPAMWLMAGWLHRFIEVPAMRLGKRRADADLPPRVHEPLPPAE